MPSRDDIWKSNYMKLVSFRDHHGHTKVTRADNDALHVWCYNQRKKNRDGHPSMTDERLDLLNDLGFGWEMVSGRPRKGTSKATGEIKKAKAAATTTKAMPSESQSTPPQTPEIPQGRAKKRTSLKTLEGKNNAVASAAAAAAAAMADLEDDDMTDTDDSSPDEPAPSSPSPASPEVVPSGPPVKPNTSFLQKSYLGASWIGSGAAELLKMFVSF